MGYALPIAVAHEQHYQPNGLWLGWDYEGEDIGLKTDRHAITIAGSRSGKGAGLIIPNLLRWQQNVLCIDPKGENAEQSWEAREAMGHQVHVIDPFRCANVPDRLRASLNPFNLLDASALTIREDIRVIADGLVMRYKADDGMWDNGAVSVLAGLIAHTLTAAPAERRNLPAVRALLNLSPDRMKALFADMQANPACGGLAQAAASIGLSGSKKDAEYLSGARDNTEWLDSQPMRDILTASSFNLYDLKNDRASVFLVLPPQYIGEHGRFLRLFVRLALNVMARGHGEWRCLFLLDEFFSLGRIDEVAKAAGLMPSYGVHLWPFLQDLGQLLTLYGREGSETFFGNSDAQIFFGNTDALTLDYVSRRLGMLTVDEADAPPELAAHASTINPVSLPWGLSERTKKQQDRDRLSLLHQQEHNRQLALTDANERARIEADNRNAMALYQHGMSKVGKPRLAPDEVRELVAKRDGDKVARAMIVFGRGDDVFQLPVCPYFAKRPTPPPPPVIHGPSTPAEIKEFERQLRERGRAFRRDQPAAWVRWEISHRWKAFLLTPVPWAYLGMSLLAMPLIIQGFSTETGRCIGSLRGWLTCGFITPWGYLIRWLTG